MKKKIGKSNKEFAQLVSDGMNGLARMMVDTYTDCLALNGGCWRCKRKKGHTKKCIAETKKREKERKIAEKKEEKRRAKKVTMTQGELEDRLEEERINYNYDW